MLKGPFASTSLPGTHRAVRFYPLVPQSGSEDVLEQVRTLASEIFFSHGFAP